MRFILYLAIALLLFWGVLDYKEQQQEKYKVTVQITEEK